MLINLWYFSGMLFVSFFKNMRLLPLLALPFLAWLLPPVPEDASVGYSPDKINLALRRTADGLLRQSGDSTSRIPAIEQLRTGVWRVRLDGPLRYDQLPALLQASLDLHGVKQPYDVAVRRCADSVIDLGYHQLDFLKAQAVPCQERDMPEGCHFIEIAFAAPEGGKPFGAGQSWMWVLFLGTLAGCWLLWHPKTGASAAAASVEGGEMLSFGHSSLDVAGQVLHCGGVRQTLTFRETKLLRLFAANPDRLLERGFILQSVWADEGILVGRSVDVFVSRLRKKLAADPSVGIVAVHGVGYRLETGKAG
jgi:hypothetical protein